MRLAAPPNPVPRERVYPIAGDIASRRGYVTGQEIRARAAVLFADVPLANMFGYSTDLRSMTQGRGTFTMEFACYRPAPANLQEAIIIARKDQPATRS